MKKPYVTLFAMMSLDGCIASAGKTIIPRKDHPFLDIAAFRAFYAEIDSIIMGYHTYEDLLENTSREHYWVFRDKQTYVYTSRLTKIDTECIRFMRQDPELLLREIQVMGGEHVWLFAGPQLIAQFMEQGLVDQINIVVIPQIIGNGTRLFSEVKVPLKLSHIATEELSAGRSLLRYQIDV